MLCAPARVARMAQARTNERRRRRDFMTPKLLSTEPRALSPRGRGDARREDCSADRDGARRPHAGQVLAGHGAQVAWRVCVTLNVLALAQPPSTLGSR